jgi:hypothetical protein
VADHDLHTVQAAESPLADVDLTQRPREASVVPDQRRDPAPDTALRMLDRSTLRERQGTYLVDHYIGLHVTVVSVALGIAGVAAASILAAPNLSLERRLLLAVLWLASLLATATAFAGTVVGSFTLPPRVPAMWDVFFPLLIALAEFILFVVLVPQLYGLVDTGQMVPYWFYSMGAFCALAAGAVIRARILLGKAHHADEIKDDIDWYRRRLVNDIVGAGCVAAVSFAAGIVQTADRNESTWGAYTFAGLVVIGLSAALYGHGQTAHKWRASLRQP